MREHYLPPLSIPAVPSEGSKLSLVAKKCVGFALGVETLQGIEELVAKIGRGFEGAPILAILYQLIDAEVVISETW